MAKLLLYLVIVFTVGALSLLFYNKLIHPALFKEELEETLEDAVEEKTRQTVQEQAKQILEEDIDVNSE